MQRHFFITVAAISLFFAAGSRSTAAQSATATLSGTVVDAQGAVVPGANITVMDVARAVERQAATNSEGYFIVTQLPPSAYTVSVERGGFATSRLPNVVLNVNDQSALRIQLWVAGLGETVTVTDTAPLVGESPAVATVVDRQFVENQPLNGRSFQTLVELSPGVVLTSSNLPNPGQFSVNGQRAGSNYFTVDGVSANFGSTASVTLYETAGGGVPSYSALGTTSSLASVDAVQEFSIQTSPTRRSSGGSRARRSRSSRGRGRTTYTAVFSITCGMKSLMRTIISPTPRDLHASRSGRTTSGAPSAAPSGCQASTTGATGLSFSFHMKDCGCASRSSPSLYKCHH